MSAGAPVRDAVLVPWLAALSLVAAAARIPAETSVDSWDMNRPPACSPRSAPPIAASPPAT